MQNATTKTETVLSVVPGTRSSGIAVFEGLDLIYYGIKEASKHRAAHTPHSRAREVSRVIEQTIHKYQPSHLVTLRLHAFQCLSSKLPIIAEQVTKTAKHFSLALHEYQRAEIRKRLYSSGRATRHAVATHLSVLYPELSRYTTEVSCWQRLYYVRMFDALAAGYIRALELQRERERLQLAQQDKRAQSINTKHP